MSDSLDNDLSIGEYLAFLLPRFREPSNREMPKWPPDVFALCAGLLLRSGSYCKVLTDWPPDMVPPGGTKEAWANKMRELGLAWRHQCNLSDDHADIQPPAEALGMWTLLRQRWEDPLGQLTGPRSARLFATALQLLAIADEACFGMGFAAAVAGDTPDLDLTVRFSNANLVSSPAAHGATLCEEVPATRMRVLPKVHTPQNGLTIRSLSQHLAICPPCEVKPEWVTVNPSHDLSQCLNVLVVPWPFVVHPKQFKVSPVNNREMGNMPPKFGFFTFENDDERNVVDVVAGLYDSALKEVDQVHMIVLPEMSVTKQDCERLREFANEKNCFLVCGYGEPPKNNRPGENQAMLVFPQSDFGTIQQSKHHRWKLDRSQVSQYGLAGTLDCEKEWWEHISLDDRRLAFASIGGNLVLSVLICEDLARPDPVGDILRAVGPSLIVAILMDGPQLKERWSSRYATALADDPGTSILTVTSLGMSRLSRGGNGIDRSRVIALWKDIRSGLPEEITLPSDSEGLVLSLAMRSADEWSADGRKDSRKVAFPTLSGVRPVKVACPQKSPKRKAPSRP
jgi:hypothetical protein